MISAFLLLLADQRRIILKNLGKHHLSQSAKISFLIIIALIFSCLRSFNANAQVLAVVGSKQITLKEFNEKLEEVKNQAVNPPTPAEFLEELIRYEVGVQEAKKRKLQDDPKVQERFRQELYKALIEQEIGEKIGQIEVSEAEMKKYYPRNPEIRTSHILIAVKPNPTAEELKKAEARAREILKEVKSSKRPFEELAKVYTDDSLSKNNGGDVGYLTRMTLPPTYFEAAIKLKQNEISDIVRSHLGFHIIKMTGRRSYDQASKRVLRAAVFDEKRKQIFDAYFKNLKKQYTIKTDPSKLPR